MGVSVMAGAEAVGNAEAVGARFCVNCGTALQGKFCGTCGSPAAIAPQRVQTSEGWGSLTSEFLNSHGRNGILSVALSFLRRPIDTIIRLTDDPTYRSQWGFLTAMVGAQLSLLYVILPRILATFFHVPATANSSAVLTSELVQYVGMAILTPIQYYVCRVLGTISRSPMSYVKLCVLSVSYGALLSIVATLIVFTAAIVIMKAAAGPDAGQIVQEIGNVFGLLTTVAVLVFVSASHRRFWGMSWPIAIVVTIAIAALSWKVVYPGLFFLAQRADIAGTFKSLLG